MIFGIGNDIIEIKRIKEAISNERFLKRYFTENEINYFSKKKNIEETVAGIFCAKEAVVKAIGTGFYGFQSCDIEILHFDNGKPYLKLHNNAINICNEKNINNIHISISHCNNYAQAIAIAEI